jgi:hypothetical protein
MPKITAMFAFVTKDKQPYDKGEGVMGFLTTDKTWMPMVGADLDRVKSLIPMADAMAKRLGIKYRIIKFTNRIDITEEIKNDL